MQTLLITGGAGFIGSNFISYLLKSEKNIKVVNLDLLTYAGSPKNLEDLENDPNYIFYKGDICDRLLLEKLFKKYNFTGVIHFAAESHVDNSIQNPDAFVKTNVFGTFTVLDVAKNFWMSAPNSYKKRFKNARFHHISTDEVYGSLSDKGLFSEKTPYAPNSPYSASKASSDFMVRSYYHTHGLNVVTTNCSNNYGPRQHEEKLIPTIIRKALSGKKIPIYGDGKNIRDWLYVLDHCKGIQLVFKEGQAGETYNIGGQNEYNNLYIVNKVCEILDTLQPRECSFKEQIQFVSDRPGHDYRYAIDATKIERELGWKASENFESGILKTIHWYLKKYN